MNHQPKRPDPVLPDDVFERLLSRASNSIESRTSQRPVLRSWQKALDAAITLETGGALTEPLISNLTQQLSANFELALHSTLTRQISATFSETFPKTLQRRLQLDLESSLKRALKSQAASNTVPDSPPAEPIDANESFASSFRDSVGTKPSVQIGHLTEEAMRQSLRYSIGKAFESVASETARQTVKTTIREPEADQTQPSGGLNGAEPQDFENLAEDIWNYGSRSHHDGEPLVFLSFEELHRLSIARQGIHLQKQKMEFYKQGRWWLRAEMDALAADLEKYTESIRNYEYISNKKTIDGGIQSISPNGLRNMNNLRKFFRDESGYDLGYGSSDWKSMEDNRSNGKGNTFRRLLLRLVGRILPVTVTYTEAEKLDRPWDFITKQPPQQVSFFVDSLVRFILALCGGALIIVPIIIMVHFPRVWTCLTVTGVSVLIFAVVVGFSEQTSNITALGVTATYAAVLVVFLGLSMESDGGGIQRASSTSW